MRLSRLSAVLVAAVLGGAALSGPASAAAPSAVPTTVPTASPANLQCSGDPAASHGEPVLLVPGTTLNPQVDFSWNYEKAFTAQGRAWCAITLAGGAGGDFAMGDIQTAGEQVADAIRTLHGRAAGQQIAVVGHSQGGMVPRWAFKYFPDTRAMVSDLIGLAPSNHGTVDAYPICAVTCSPSIWQQQTGSKFLKALNAGAETYAGISYTQVYSLTDEVVVPNFPLITPASSELHTGAGAITNIASQSVCPLVPAEHLSVGTSDPVGYAAVMDALDHAGPADVTRFPATTCASPIAPGIDPVSFATNFAAVVATAGTQIALAPKVSAEPALRDYAK